MFLVYMAVRNVEKEAQKYSFARYSSSKKKNMMMSRRVMLQGILYSVALASICLAYILMVFIPALYPSYVLTSILFPLQGFWNALIYMKPLFRQIVKKTCKSQQNVSGSTQQDNQNASKISFWLTRLNMFWIRKRKLKESKGSSNEQVEEVQDESKKEEDDIVEGGRTERVLGGLKTNDRNQGEEKRIHVNANGSALSNSIKLSMFKDIKEDNSNALNSSSFIACSCVEQEETGELLSFAFSQNSELKNEEQSQLDYFSALEEVNNEGCDNVADNEDNNSDDESYVDDYLRMMELGS